MTNNKNKYWLASNLINMIVKSGEYKSKLSWAKEYLKQNKLITKITIESQLKKITRVLTKIQNNEDAINKAGFLIKYHEKHSSKFTLIRTLRNIKLTEQEMNALLDVLSLAEVSNNFHYKNDIPALKSRLFEVFDLKDESFEHYVGHNNKSEDFFNDREKLRLIKQCILDDNAMKFSIQYDEENDGDNKLLLRSKKNDSKLGKDFAILEVHRMKPIEIIHDSDETFISFIKSKKDTDRSLRYYVNISNIIHKHEMFNNEIEIITDRSLFNKLQDVKKVEHKYTFQHRRSIRMKITSKNGYKLVTRQANFSIVENNKDYMILEFSEIYHALNFIFMHDGPKNLFGEFFIDKDNIPVLKAWDEKWSNIKND